jgi:hypothetical protein
MRQAEIKPNIPGGTSAGQVINVILAPAGFDPGNGIFIVPSNTAQMWDTFADGVFTPGEPPASAL